MPDNSHGEAEERPPSCLDLVGAIAQPNRRAVFAALVLARNAMTIAEIARITELRPPTAAAALRKLADHRMVCTEPDGQRYRLVDDVFIRAVRQEVRVAGDESGDGSGAYFRRGRLRAIPGDTAVRSRVLSVVIESFEHGVSYPEAKVNALCGEWLDDWVSLRRALVDEGFLRRTRTGTRYERS